MSADKGAHLLVSESGEELSPLFDLSPLDLLQKRFVIVICKSRQSALKKSPVYAR